jgi:hypothetical protein
MPGGSPGGNEMKVARSVRKWTSTSAACLSAVFLFFQDADAIDVSDVPMPVVLIGASVPPFLGMNVDRIRVCRYDAAADQWTPIPFQIDETDGTGSYRGARNHALDPTDEIVFLDSDLGDSASADRWVADAEAGLQHRMRIGIADSRRPGGRGWVYVYLTATLAKSPVRYVRYDEAQDRVDTDWYELTHSAAHGFVENLVLKTAAGGDGVDFLDRQKMRFKVRVSQVNKDLVLKEQMDGDVKLMTGVTVYMHVRKKRSAALTDPVVRLNREMVIEISGSGKVLFQNINFADSLRFRTMYTPAAGLFTTDNATIPDPDEYDGKEIRVSTDLLPNATGMRFFNAGTPSGVRIDGTMDWPDGSLAWPGRNGYLIAADPGYAGAALKSGSIVGLWEFSGSPLGDTRSYYYKDVAAADDGDTGDRRSYGDTGILVQAGKLTGFLSWENWSFFLPFNVGWEQARALLDRQAAPPSIASVEERRLARLELAVDPPGAGTVTIGPYGVPYPDSTVVLTAAPAEGYVFAGWDGDLSGSANPATLRMDGPKQVTARFAKPVQIAFDTDPSGLLLRVDGRSCTAPAAFAWKEGETHTFSLDSLETGAAKTRYAFTGWSDGGPRSRAYTVPAGDVSLTAAFATQYFVTTVINPRKTGSVDPSPPGAWYAGGATARLEAFPSAGYAFLNWSGDASGSQNPIRIPVNGPKLVRVNFGNPPPSVSWPDTSFAEDDTLRIPFAAVLRWISDPNDPDTALSVRVTGGLNVGAEADSGRGLVLLFSRAPEWSGADSLTVTVVDPSGQETSVKPKVRVIPVPEPPGPFALVSPADRTSVTAWPESFEFVWEPSIDPDPGDAVTYIFQLDTSATFSSTRCIKVPSLPENRYTLAWPVSYGDGRYYWTVAALDQTRRVTWSGSIFTLELATGIDAPGGSGIPAAFVLDRNYPNPFNGGTEITFGLPRTACVTLCVFDGTGRLVATLAEASFGPGYHRVHWDGTDRNGTRLPSGLYLIRAETPGSRIVRKILLLQ